MQLRAVDRVWAEVDGWQDRRFDSHPETRPVERFADRNTLSRPRPGGWVVLHERWPDLASRDLIMRNHLSSAERARYEQQPRGRRAWLLGRIAVKDAVRQWLWEQGEGPVFPAEIEVLNDPSGRPRVAGLHGRVLPALDVSLAHRAEAAVALVHPVRPSGGPGAGIDLEEVTERPAGTLEVALGPAERHLLTDCQQLHGGSEALWFARFWAAKEAVAKAQGTGLGAATRVRRHRGRARHPAGGRGRTRWTVPAPTALHRAEQPTRPAGAPLRRGLDHGGRPRGRPPRREDPTQVTSSEQRVDLRPPTEQEVLTEITGMLAVVLADYGLDEAEVTMESRFTDDLELESIDLVTLAGQLQERWGERINFAEFIAGMELEEIIGLTVGRLVRHVVDRLQHAERS